MHLFLYSRDGANLPSIFPFPISFHRLLAISSSLKFLTATLYCPRQSGPHYFAEDVFHTLGIDGNGKGFDEWGGLVFLTEKAGGVKS